VCKAAFAGAIGFVKGPRYKRDDYVGSQAVFSDLTFSELPQLANMNRDAAGVDISLRRAGDLVILEGRADLTSLNDPDADVSLNVAFPDSAATYWTTPFYAEEGLSIEVEGTYPNARYMSFNVYNEDGGSFQAGGVSSGLADFEMDPDQGSVNPFQTNAEPGGSFTVTLSGEAKSGQSNILDSMPKPRASNFAYSGLLQESTLSALDRDWTC